MQGPLPISSWRKRLPAALIILAILVVVPSASAVPPQNDAGSHGDAGDSLALATPVTPYGIYSGLLAGAASDPNDYYSFPADLGEQINIEIRDVLGGGSAVAGDNDTRLSFRLLGPGGTLLDTPNTNQGDTRVAIAAAPVTGTYYFQVTEAFSSSMNYRFCFLVIEGDNHSCPDIGMRGIDVFAGSLRQAQTRVLLVPPAHGDLGNTLGGPSLQQYLTATINAIHEWELVIDMFVADHPEYAYLDQIDIEVQVFDGSVMATADYDLAIVYVETALTAFRGVASTCLDTPRCIALSLFSSSPRGGQLVPDYPELNDLDAVVKHEFGHTFGLGHTLTWTDAKGPDLMNSPAPFMYGDGDPAGDGGERTPRKCLSNLDLYGLAKIYEWLPSGIWRRPDANRYLLPAGWTYKWYCP